MYCETPCSIASTATFSLPIAVTSTTGTGGSAVLATFTTSHALPSGSR